MTYSSSIAKNQAPLVLDTSVLINLQSCGAGRRILVTLPNVVVVPKIVVSELELPMPKTSAECKFVHDLVVDGILKIVDLDEGGFELFGELVSGSPSLGDGEAATIATAATLGYTPVIDDRKGRTLAEPHISQNQPAWSLDILCHPKVVAELGDEASVEALYQALRVGRMRIHRDHCQYVLGAIGPGRAVKCTSLPDYKAQRPIWEQLCADSQF